jgi:phosphoadenosine phosphosulfate reductase
MELLAPPAVPVDVTPHQTTPEPLSAPERIEWAVDRFGDGLVLTCSFQEIVLLDMVARVAPSTKVVFIDTGSHFPQTLDFVQDMAIRYALNLEITTPEPDAGEHPCGSAHCCEYRKVRPLRQALAGSAAWMTGIKRSDGPTRVDTPVVAWDTKWHLVKVCPLADWSQSDIVDYEVNHALPVHPLRNHGYGSIGCEPTTQAPHDPADPRSGRWAQSSKTECGLHV